MSHMCKLKVADALAKSLEVSKKDAETFPQEKANIFSPIHICCLAQEYERFDPDSCLLYLESVESQRKRLRSDMAYVFKIWIMDSCTNLHVNRKVHWEHRMRLMDLVTKYGINVQYRESSKIFLVFPDIFCNLLMKHSNNTFVHVDQWKEYQNFKDEHKWQCYIGLLPSGKKYGGFVKAIIHGEFAKKRFNLIFFMQPEICIIDHIIAQSRSIYNSKIISEEKRLEFFENMDLKEHDCTLWSQIFDKKFPQFSYIHKLFGQLA